LVTEIFANMLKSLPSLSSPCEVTVKSDTNKTRGMLRTYVVTRLAWVHVSLVVGVVFFANKKFCLLDPLSFPLMLLKIVEFEAGVKY
jgi:hypothetical protein